MNRIANQHALKIAIGIVVIAYLLTGVLSLVAYRTIQHLPGSVSPGVASAFGDLTMLNGFKQFAYGWYLVFMDNLFFLGILQLGALAVGGLALYFLWKKVPARALVPSVIILFLLGIFHWMQLPFALPEYGAVNLATLEQDYLTNHTQAVTADDKQVFLAVAESDRATEIIAFDHDLAPQTSCTVRNIFVSDLATTDGGEELILFGSRGAENHILRIDKGSCQITERQVLDVEGFTTFGAQDEAGHIWVEVVRDDTSLLLNLDDGSELALPDVPRGGMDFAEGDLYKFSGLSIMRADSLNIARVDKNAQGQTLALSKRNFPEFYGLESEGIALTDDAVYIAVNYNYQDGAIWKFPREFVAPLEP